MEPRREDPKESTPEQKEKPRRFRIVKLEERIAPAYGQGQGHGIYPTKHGSTCDCAYFG
jgi:hypothetical protein